MIMDICKFCKEKCNNSECERIPLRLWGVFTQFSPHYKYPETLQSIWTTKDFALKTAKEDNIHDFVWIREIMINSEVSYDETCELIRIKQ